MARTRGSLRPTESKSMRTTTTPPDRLHLRLLLHRSTEPVETSTARRPYPCRHVNVELLAPRSPSPVEVAPRAIGHVSIRHGPSQEPQTDRSLGIVPASHAPLQSAQKVAGRLGSSTEHFATGLDRRCTPRHPTAFDRLSTWSPTRRTRSSSRAQRIMIMANFGVYHVSSSTAAAPAWTCNRASWSCFRHPSMS